MEIIYEIVESLIRGTLLGISLVICGYGLLNICSFFVKKARKLFRQLSSHANKR